MKSAPFPDRLLPAAFERHHGVCALRADEDALVVATSRPREAVASEIAFLSGMRVEWEVVGEQALEALMQNREDPEPPHSSDPQVALHGTIPERIDALLFEASRRGGSDIHIEPFETFVRIRCRVDGVLYVLQELPAHDHAALTARIKILADLDIAERRRPQDGRITREIGGREIDLRVSTFPTAWGEKVVLRLLDRRDVQLKLSHLGLSERHEHILQRALAKPHGMIVTTGPTGSGKTTTLYSALQEINDGARNITTIEDPIEYDLEGIAQSQVHREIDYTFASALRALLRQDPDVIMLGEVRDSETARIAVRAALTGHLVLATLHTNDAPSAPARLIDMGVEPYLVAASLRLVIAQRLLRRACPACASVHAAPNDAIPAEAVSEEAASAPEPAVLSAQGCASCGGTGYRGRTAVFEMMAVSDKLRSMISQRRPASALREALREGGNISLRDAAWELAYAHVTTPEEVLRATA